MALGGNVDLHFMSNPQSEIRSGPSLWTGYSWCKAACDCTASSQRTIATSRSSRSRISHRGILCFVKARRCTQNQVFFGVVPVPRQRNVRTPSHPRPDAQSENEGDMYSSGNGGASERSHGSDGEDMGASQDELPAVEKQGKAARGVPAF